MFYDAYNGYRAFFEEHPNIKNPTDINSREKLGFFVSNGFDLDGFTATG